MALGRVPEWVIEQIGHNGSAEPYKAAGLKAGFHEQECIEVALGLGYTCTPIEAVPTISPYQHGGDARPVYFGEGLSGNFEAGVSGNWVRLLRHMVGTCGVLTGTYAKLTDPTCVRGHAVAWDGVTTQKIHDPIGPRCYSFVEAAKYGFTPGCFWKVE
jgi:hypothetical protein